MNYGKVQATRYSLPIKAENDRSQFQTKTDVRHRISHRRRISMVKLSSTRTNQNSIEPEQKKSASREIFRPVEIRPDAQERRRMVTPKEIKYNARHRTWSTACTKQALRC